MVRPHMCSTALFISQRDVWCFLLPFSFTSFFFFPFFSFVSFLLQVGFLLLVSSLFSLFVFLSFFLLHFGFFSFYFILFYFFTRWWQRWLSLGIRSKDLGLGFLLWLWWFEAWAVVELVCLDFLVEVVVLVEGCWWVWIFHLFGFFGGGCGFVSGLCVLHWEKMSCER